MWIGDCHISMEGYAYIPFRLRDIAFLKIETDMWSGSFFSSCLWTFLTLSFILYGLQNIRDVFKVMISIGTCMISKKSWETQLNLIKFNFKYRNSIKTFLKEDNWKDWFCSKICWLDWLIDWIKIASSLEVNLVLLFIYIYINGI